MQQFIACSEDAFAFGEPDEVVLRNYEYLLPEDCLRISRVKSGIADPKYGYRYKLLWEGIASFVTSAEGTKRLNDDFSPGLYVALVVIPSGPLFVDLRQPAYARPELEPAAAGMHLQFYLPSTMTGTGRHQCCGQKEGPPLLPTRVVDVGLSDAETRLHMSQPGEKSHYVALSHCWGGTAPTITTSSIVNDFVKELPAKLPQTFADAISVTRTMGQKYLWIDSLCIVQDSTEDWLHESSLMDEVYSNALLTILADAAQNSFSGFLEPPARSTRKLSVITCDPTLTESTPMNVHVRERGDLAFQLPYHDFQPAGPWSGNPFDLKPDAPITSRLSTRAWAFQERLLSPRTLHFGPSEMAWECRSICSCECSAINERTSRVTSLLKNSIALVPTITATGGPVRIDLRSLDDAWRRDIVEHYSRLDLTNGKDRLYALVGIARRASKLRLGDQFLAGMWRNTIKEGLSWYTMPGYASFRSPSELLLPTWTWASVSGHIRHARDADIPSEAPLIDILSVEYTASVNAPQGAGPLTPASLLGLGYLVPIDNIWFQPYKYEDLTSGSMGLYAIYRSCYRVQWPPNIGLPVNCIAMMDVHGLNPPNEERIQLDRLEGMELEGMNLVMLLTALSKGVVYGLVLNLCGSTGGVPEYERVGFINGMDAMGELVSWSSSSHSRDPLVPIHWEIDENEGITAFLKSSNIQKSTVRIR